MSDRTLRRLPPHKSKTSSIARLVGRAAVPTAGIAFAIWGAVVVAGLPSKGQATQSAAAAAAYVHTVRGALTERQAQSHKATPTAKEGRQGTVTSAKVGRVAAVAVQVKSPADAGNRKRKWSDIFGNGKAVRLDPAVRARFEKIAAANSLDHAKLAKLFDSGTSSRVASIANGVAAADPHASRFGPAPTAASELPMLAYADPSPAGSSKALAAMPSVTPLAEAARSAEENEENDADGTALFPDYEDTPDATPVPLSRPKGDDNDRQNPRAKPASIEPDDKVVAQSKSGSTEEKAGESDRPTKRAEQKLAYARPDNPADAPSGGLFKNFFRPRASAGVAVYDISAAKVYMPDGSVLEAHSGIGKMADNPKYVHVKMNGPTPPHTYNLKMREKRFHGVEAIRMLPVDGKNKHGRDGFLTHSYLLRGGRAESHGCVAFKNYDKFLRAFKQGKIKQLVVVPGGGRAPAVQIAKHGRDA